MSTGDRSDEALRAGWEGAGAMVLNLLAARQSPDLPDVLIHMTGRAGTPGHGTPASIASFTPVQRLAGILFHRSLWYCQPFDGPWPVACLSQMTRTALAALTPSRYAAVGIAFHKQAVFNAGGGPALYIRGDQYDAFREAAVDDRFKAMAVRYWPGRTAPYTLEEVIRPQSEMTRSEWVMEREWRITRPNGTDPGWCFAPTDVAFLIVNSLQVRDELLSLIGGRRGPTEWVASLEVATLDGTTGPFVGAEDRWP